MSQLAGATLSPSTYNGPLPSQNTTTLIESPAFLEFLTGLWTWGHVILLVDLNSMVPHHFQRELDSEHVNKLAQSIQHNNMSYLYPMKGSTTYDWDILHSFSAFAQAPQNIKVSIFDGGHRLAAAQSLKNGITHWPVELFPESKLLSQRIH